MHNIIDVERHYEYEGGELSFTEEVCENCGRDKDLINMLDLSCEEVQAENKQKYEKRTKIMERFQEYNRRMRIG